MKNLLGPAIMTLSAFSSAVYAHGSDGRRPSALPMGLDPAHLHLLTNHIPIFITLSGLIALGLAFLWKNDAVRRAGLILLLIGTTGGLVTYWLGQHAYKPVRGLVDETGQDWLDLHMERAEQMIWFLWIAPGSALAALVVAWRKSRFLAVAPLLAGALGVAALGVSGWIADAGGKIRHPEIRGSSVPTAGETEASVQSSPHEH